MNGNLRSNLEAQFQSYEKKIAEHSLSLVQKLATQQRDDLKADLLGLFVCKFLNFLRNPNCIVKVLNSLGSLPEHHFAAEELSSVQVVSGRGSKPHRVWLCSTFGVSPETYDRWLRALFLLVTPARPGEANLLEQTVKTLFEDRFVTVFVYNYVGKHETEACLLSDRGHTISLQTVDDFSMDFNVCRTAFARFVFSDIDAHVPPGTPPAYVEAFKRERRVSLRYIENDVQALKMYNGNTAYQCAKYVSACDELESKP